MFRKIRSAIAMFFLFFCYLVSPSLGTYYLITGSLSTQLFLIGVLIYQYIFCKESKLFQRFLMWLDFMGYFSDFHVILEDESLKQKQSNILVCYHPHGVMTYGMAIASVADKIFEDFWYLGSRLVLLLPFGGIVMKLRGIRGVNHHNFKEFMKKGKKIIIIPGGFEEATITDYNEDRVFIKNRKGFIKYALQHEYTVFPCYGFNENKTYYYFSCIKLGLFLNKFKIPGVFFFSKFLNLLPNFDVDLVTVVGNGIKMPLIPHPTKEDIDKYHQIYIEELVRLFNKYAERFNKTQQLKIY